jgi:hypothetical protein
MKTVDTMNFSSGERTMGRPFLIEKRCSKCRETFPATNEYFHYRNKAKKYLMTFCKPCSRKHKLENRERELHMQRIRRAKTSRLCRICESVAARKGCWYCGPCKKASDQTKKRKDKCIYTSRLRKATPKWTDKTEIRAFYESKPEGYEVDHVVPIRGKNVCGLHVPDNLQYLTAEANRTKSNSWRE